MVLFISSSTQAGSGSEEAFRKLNAHFANVSVLPVVRVYLLCRSTDSGKLHSGIPHAQSLAVRSRL